MKGISINKQQLTAEIIQIFWEIAGSLFIAVGIYNFAVQAEFPMT